MHEPIPGYDKDTYQATLKGLATTFEQYVFEMEHSTAGTLRDIEKWRYDRPNCFEARYEDLRRDVDTTYWRGIADYLGFGDWERQSCARRFWQNSLFGGLSRFRNKHIRSGDVGQWMGEFTNELAHAFLERFPTTLQSLAYEKDNRWVQQLTRPGASRSISSPRWQSAARIFGYPIVATDGAV